MVDFPPYGYGTAVPPTHPGQAQPQQWQQPLQPLGSPQIPQRSQYLAQALAAKPPTISSPAALGTNLLAQALMEDGDRTRQANQQSSYLEATDPQLSDDLQQLGIGGQRQNLLQRAGSALGGMFNLGNPGGGS